MKKKYCLSVIVLVIFVLGIAFINTSQAPSVNAFSNNADFSITVTGTGIVSVRPDIATINLNVETKNKNLEIAQSQNAGIMKRLIDVLKQQDITEDDISTVWFNIYPEYDYNSGFEQRFSGHRVSNQLCIKIRDIASVDKIINLSTAAGATTVSGIQFGVENNSEAYNEALVKAIESAKQKAAVLSSVTDLNELRVVSVKENPVYHFGFGRYDRVISSESLGGASIMHNDIEVSATVEVVFASNI